MNNMENAYDFTIQTIPGITWKPIEFIICLKDGEQYPCEKWLEEAPDNLIQAYLIISDDIIQSNRYSAKSWIE